MPCSLQRNLQAVIGDATGAIFVYTGSAPTVTLGQSVAVGGTVANYNKALQITSPTITDKGSGSPTYGDPASYGLTEVTAWNSDDSNRKAEYITLTGIAKSAYDIVVGAGATANATTYYAHSSVTAMAAGDYVSVTGYAINVMPTPSRLGIVPTSITKDDSKPAIVTNDIVDVVSNGVTNQSLTITPYRISGWTATVSYTGCVSAADKTSDALTAIQYSVSKNNDPTPKTGTIVVTFSKDAEPNVVYTINVSQKAQLPTVSTTMQAIAEANGWEESSGSGTKHCHTSIELDSHITMSTTGSANCGSYWTDKTWRLYEGQSGDVTITAASGYHLISVKFTYSKNNNGSLKNGSSWVASNEVVETTDQSKTLTVGHSSGTKNGTVMISAVEVVYCAD